MKKFKLIYLVMLLMVNLGISAQSTDRNYILEQIMLDKDALTSNEIIRYYDGLGRPEATVKRNYTPSGQDLSTFTVYDNYGRIESEYMPFAISGNGAYVDHEKALSSGKTLYKDSAPYTKIVYESSPLNRVNEEYGAGNNWHYNSKSVKTSYLSNIPGNDSLNCIIYRIADTRDLTDTVLTIRREGNYPVGSLYVTLVKDEDEKKTFLFKDKQDRTVLQRRVLGNGNSIQYADTYYIHDDSGNSAAILSPEASKSMKSGTSWSNANSAILREYAYLYIYDSRGLCRARRPAGQEWIYTIHDSGGRPVFTQDGIQRKNGKWGFTLYDVHDRVCITGLCRNTFTPMSTQIPVFTVNAFKDAGYTGEEFGYSIDTTYIKIESSDVFIVNYYDDYSFINSVSHFSSKEGCSVAYESVSGYGEKYADAKGKLTGILEYVEDEGKSEELPYMLYTVIYYDDNDRPIQERSYNHLGGMDNKFYAYDFSGNITKLRSYHSNSLLEGTSAPVVKSDDVYSYTYDKAGRLLKVTMSRNGGTAKTVESNVYDEAGRLSSTAVANGAATIRYTYNARNFTTSINDGISFFQNLYYDSSEEGCNPLFNGNPTRMDWSSSGNGYALGEITRMYRYSYDGMNRLTEAVYEDEYGDNYDRSFSETRTYDLNSNITGLCRKGLTLYYEDVSEVTEYGDIDNINFVYAGNRIIKSTDSAGSSTFYNSTDFKDSSDEEIEYTYDKCGRLTSDLNRGVTLLQRFESGLPSKVAFSGMHENIYSYTASGRKLRTKKHRLQTYLTTIPSIGLGGETAITGVDTLAMVLSQEYYSRDNIYINSSTPITLTPNGYIKNDTLYAYVRDIGGSIRSIISEYGKVVEYTHYYPSGSMIYDCAQPSVSVQSRKFSGKEMDRDNGLNMVDFHARWYDPHTCRFIDPDEKLESYPGLSPYAYCAGNPNVYIDPTGQEIWINETNYNIGMNYGGDDEFIRMVNNALNTISECGGYKLIYDLVNSKEKYNYTNTSQNNSYTQKNDENVVISLSESALSNKDSFYSAVAHETMHGVQYENGQGGASIYNEVEAYAFEYIMSINSFLTNGATEFQSLGNTTNNNQAGNLYGKSFEKLTLNFNVKDMKNAVTYFKIGATANNTGIYNSYPIILDQNKKSMLHKYNIRLK